MSKYSENMPSDIKGAVGWILGYIQPDTELLDFGCSTGYFGEYIKKAKKIKVDGLELSDDRFEAAKKLGKVYSFDLDLAQWPDVIKQQYDYLFFGDVLEHLKNPAAALTQASKLLKDDGKIFVSVPNIAHMSVRLELLSGKFKYESMGILDNTHLQYFTLESFGRVANESGFDCELVDITVNDIPKEISEKYLKNAGLSANKKFWEITQQKEARAYQFKFILTRNTKKFLLKKMVISVEEKPLQFRDMIIKDYKSQLDTIHKHADEQAKIINHYTDLSENLERKNQVLEAENEKLNRKLINRLGTILKKRTKKDD